MIFTGIVHFVFLTLLWQCLCDVKNHPKFLPRSHSPKCATAVADTNRLIPADANANLQTPRCPHPQYLYLICQSLMWNNLPAKILLRNTEYHFKRSFFLHLFLYGQTDFSPVSLNRNVIIIYSHYAICHLFPIFCFGSNFHAQWTCIC